MSKPSIAELLNASGHTTYTPPLVMRAMYALYGNIGANLDERNWSVIMQSSTPLKAAEAGLLGMYQDSGYLLRNTSHLVQSGYVAAQAEITYRQMGDRLGFTYQHDWSVGTSYESLGQLSMDQLIALVPVTPVAPPPPLPTISITSSVTGFIVSLNVAGTVKMSVSGDLASFAAGVTVLTEQAAIKEGFLTLTANGNNSAATSQYVVLGTSGNDTIDTSAVGNRADYIFGGAGNNTLKGGAGDDVIVGGSGNDTITGGDGTDQLTGGAGADVFIYTTRDESYYSGAGTPLDTIVDFATGTDQIRFSLSGNAVNASSFATVGNFVDGKNNSIAYSTVDKALYVSATGTNLNNTTAGAYVVSSTRAIAAGDLQFVIAGTDGDDVLKGGVGKDTITGGTGNDTITGGAGADILSGATGSNRFIFDAVFGTSSDSNINTGVDSITDLNAGDVLVAKLRNVNVFDASLISGDPDASNYLFTGAWAGENLLMINAVQGTGTTGESNLGSLRIGIGTYSSDTAAAQVVYDITGTTTDDAIVAGAKDDIITGGDGADSLSGGNGDDVFQYTDNLQLREDSAVNGGDGIDTIAFSVAIDTLTGGSAQGDNFHADFTRVTGVERIKLFGASLINLGDVLPGVGITTIATGDDSTTLRYDNIALGTLNIDATALADNKTLTLTQAGGPGTGQWFSVAELKGDVNAAGLQGGIAVTAAMGSGFDVSILGGNGNDTLTGGAGSDTINGGAGNDTINGGAGADELTGGLGNDRFVFNAIFGASSDSNVITGVDSILDLGAGDLIVANLSNMNLFDASMVNGESSSILTNRWAGQNLLMIKTVSGNDEADQAFPGNLRLGVGTYSADSANAQVEYHITGTSGSDTIRTGSNNDTINGGAGADVIDGGVGNDTYRYATASESTINNVASAATGFDTVRITSGDIFDFAVDVSAVRTAQYYVGQTPQANGNALLTQLDSYYQSAGPSSGIDAMYISIGNNAKGRFLVIDVDNNNQITSNDLIIEIVGITNNKNIQLGLTGGNVVMYEVDPIYD